MICFRAQGFYVLWDETDPEPGDAGPDATVWQASLWLGVVGVFDDPIGLPPAPLSEEDLHGLQLQLGDVLTMYSLTPLPN